MEQRRVQEYGAAISRQNEYQRALEQIMPDKDSKLLEGIRVIEMASYISGPLSGSLLCELGAEVIKLEHPPTGDPFRGWGSAESPRASFRAYNTSKSSVCVDWTSERAWFDELLQSSDVLLSNFRPSTQEKLGLTFDRLKLVNPQIIVCNITGFGKAGEYAERPCYDAVAQAMSGLMSQLTDLDNPQCVGPPLSDSIAGLYSTIGILAAIVERQNTGVGRAVDVSMVGASLSLIRNAVGSELLDGAPSGKLTRAMSSQSYAFVGSDGNPFVVHLSTPQKFWLGLLDTVARTELAADER
ncbi:MAG: CoA transferase, partial [Actinomycetota bacterium]